MAYGGRVRSNTWDLLCPVCKNFIETNSFDDLQASLDFHYLNMHPQLRNLSQLSKDAPVLNNKNTTYSMNECTNYIICPVCDKVVEILQNNINHCFMEHYEICHQHVDIQGSVQKYINHSIEELKNEVDNLNLKDSTAKVQPNEILNLPPDLEKHRGYLTLNNSYCLCHVCGETLNTEQRVENHLKTKRHEDNVIFWLKGKLSTHMQSSMEFVSFYGSNLCCNLCRCKIDMNSQNPHETLLNIISHNADAKHQQPKSIKDPVENKTNFITLKSLTEKSSIIKEHQEFVETEIEPRFKCKLCETTINFSKNHVELEQNFVLHIKSALHRKNSQAITVLRMFREINGNRDEVHRFSVSNGVVNCTQCNCTVPANIEQLLKHCQTSSNVKISKTKESAPPLVNKSSTTQRSNFSSHNSLVPEAAPKTSSEPQRNRRQTVKPTDNRNTVTKKSYITEILRPLKNQFGNITCIAENEDGKLTCLVCNCPVQPSTHGVKMHILGKFHKIKTQSQIKQLNTLDVRGETYKEPEFNSDNLGTGSCSKSYQGLIEHLFLSLPQIFQDDKDFCTINLSDGSLNCILCGCTIDPMLIQVHLQGQRHILQKQLQSASNTRGTN